MTEYSVDSCAYRLDRCADAEKEEDAKEAMLSLPDSPEAVMRRLWDVQADRVTTLFHSLKKSDRSH